MHKNPLNSDKVKNAIAYFCIELKRTTSEDPSQMLIYKYLALLDLTCVERFGTPSLGLKYCAMKMGPVASEIYDNRGYFINDRIAMMPVSDCETKYIFTSRCKQASLEKFSKAEIEIMRDLVLSYAGKPLDIITDATHSLRAWIIAYGDGSSGRVPMRYQDQLDGGIDDPRLEALSLYEFFKK